MNRQTLETSPSYATALARARSENLVILSRNREISACRTVYVYVVYNPAKQSEYIVKRVDINTLTCTCTAARNARYCKHRALVTASLLAENLALHAAMAAELPPYQATRDAAENASKLYKHRVVLMSLANIPSETIIAMLGQPPAGALV